MEKKERLQLLLAYGFLSLFFGFMTVVVLAFINFPFKPGSFLAILTTLAVFITSFYCSGRVVSRHMSYSEEDAHFVAKLVVGVGIALMILDAVFGSTKVSAVFSGCALLVVFYLSTTVFLKPKAEDMVAEARQHVIRVILPAYRYAAALSRKAYYSILLVYGSIRNTHSRTGERL